MQIVKTTNDKPLALELRQKVAANLFPTAHAAINWDRFPWHSDGAGGTDAWQPNSSQALAIDVFGTLKLAPERHAILDEIAASIGLPVGGSWEVELEWTDPLNLLREPRQRTQVDAIARSPRSLLLFECKFTEGNGGSCSQTRKKKSLQGTKLPQCSGLYQEQVNPINGVPSRCALTGKGVRYWDIIPELFDLDRDSNHSPCPFVGPWYQWMRNMVLCHEAARQEGLEPGFLVVYADASTLPFPNVLASDDWLSFTALINKGAPPLAALSYQKLLTGAQQNHGGMWKDLETWVIAKIDKVLTGWRDTLETH